MKNKGMLSSDLMVYLTEIGYPYDPYQGTFNDFIKSLNLRPTFYNKRRRYVKANVIKQLKNNVVTIND